MQQLAISGRMLRRPLSRARGYTVQELIVTVAIAGTVSGGAVAASNVLRDTTMVTAANDLIAHLNFARSTAIMQGADTVVCPSTDQIQCAEPVGDFTIWKSGWLVYVDRNGNGQPDQEEVVRTHAGKGANDVAIRSSRYRRQIAYHSSGTAGGSTITLAVCDGRGAASARYVTVSNTGRARLSRTTSSDMRCS
jgi:type IV fimbrial biogenesis protein FimT